MALGTSFTQVTKSGLSSTSAYNTGHINSSGIITATKFVGTLEGNVTSDDWTNTATGISTTVNVGIGTTNATSKLYLKGGSNENITLKIEPGATAGNYSELVLGRTSSAPAAQTTPVVKGGNAISGVPGVLFGSENTNLPCVVIQTPNSSNGHIVFKPKGSAKVRITADGDVGIGTDDPASLLHISNLSGATEMTVTSSTQPRLMLKTTGTSAECRVDFGDSGDSSRGAIGYNHTDDALKFYTSGVTNEALRITSTGQVAIGTVTAETNFLTTINGDLSLGETSGTDNTFIDQKQDGDLHLINSGRTANGASGTPGAGGVGINRYNNIAGGTSLFRDFTVYNGKGSKVLVVDGSASGVGIGTDSPDSKLSVYSASAGSVSADADADELTLESSGNTGMSILSPGTGESSIYFGNPGTNGQKEAWLKYFHETHTTTAKRRSLRVKVGGVETAYFNSTGLVLANDKGISFINADDTASGETVNSSVITDYEEGTWTPTNDIGLTLTVNNTAHYIKVGRLVTIWFDISLTGNPDSAQCSAIQSLPYTSEDSDNYYGQSNSVWYSNTNDDKRDHDDDNTLIYVDKDSTTIKIWNVTSNHLRVRSWAAHSSSQGRRFRGTMTYRSKY